MPRVVPRVLTLSAQARMQLMWLASPALPVGGFSYSEVLEAAVDSGHVTNEAQAQAWLIDQLLLSVARCDLAVVVRAVPAWQRQQVDRLHELNAWVLLTRETSELRLQTEQTGRSLLEWLRNHPEASADPRLRDCAALPGAPTWPVAFALALARLLPPLDHHPGSQAVLKDALLSFTFGWAENMVQAAIKAVPLGQIAGQRILQAVLARIPDAIDHACRLSDSERQAFTPMLAILSAQHETQYSRLFRS